MAREPTSIGNGYTAAITLDSGWSIFGIMTGAHALANDTK